AKVYYNVGKSNNTLAFPVGICPTVGVGGHLSGGGYGTLLHYTGHVADHVTDVSVIDPNGQIRNRQSLGKDVFLGDSRWGWEYIWDRGGMESQV
ncbi:Tetrahydroberberine oxidase, partial [Linum perenne]